MKKPILIEIIIWTFILAMVFSGIIFAYSKFFVEPNVYTIEFKDIDGITNGSPVRFMGINVGYVRNLESVDKHVNVQILVTKKDMKIPNGTVAKVEFFGLGGSKSIELMPPDGSCDVGIVTGDTIRIADVTSKVGSLVDVIEFIERYLKSVDKLSAERVLEIVETFEDGDIKVLGNKFNSMKTDISSKVDELIAKQDVFRQKVNIVNENVEKINKFIKK